MTKDLTTGKIMPDTGKIYGAACPWEFISADLQCS